MDCIICNRIEMIEKGTNKHFVCEMQSGYVVLGDSQFYKGYTLLLSKQHCSELHQLDQETKLLFLKEMSVVAEAVYNVFQPIKLNQELLGNRDAHLHWHIFPRHTDDPNIHNPVWIIDKEIRNHTVLEDQELEERKELLKREIELLMVT